MTAAVRRPTLRPALVLTVLVALGPAAPPAPGEEPGPAPADALGDPMPAGSVLRVGTHRFRDGGATNQAVLSPDGRLIATGSESGITLFEIPSGRRVLHLPDCGVPNGYSPNNGAFAFSADGKRLFTLSGTSHVGAFVPNGVAVYEIPGGKRLARFDPPRGDGYRRLWLPAGSPHLVTVRDKQTVLLDPDTGAEVGRLPFTAAAAAATPGGVRLFAAAPDGTAVAVHDAEGKAVRELAHVGHPEVLGFAPDGSAVAAATAKSEVRVWDLATGKVLADVTVPEPATRGTPVTVLAVAGDGSAVYAGTQGGTIYRFALPTGKELPRLDGHTGWVTALLPADGGRTLVSAGWGHRVIRYDVATGKAQPDPPGYAGYLHVDRTDDGALIAAADGSGRVELLDGRTGRRVRELRAAGGPTATAVAFAPGGRVLATADRDGVVRLWDVAAGRAVRDVKLGPAPKDASSMWFEGLRFAPDGARVVASGRGWGTRAFTADTGREVWADAGRVGPVAFTPDGATVVSGGWGDALQIRDAVTGRVRESAAVVGRVTDDAAASPDGRLLATGHHDGHVCLRSPDTGAVVKEWQAHTPGQVTWGVSFGPLGAWLATSGDTTVAVWDAQTGTLLRRYDGHASRATSVRFAADGRTVLSSSMDLTALVWDVRPPAPAARTAAQLWDDLGGEPGAAFRAVWLAAADPAAPALFAEKVPPVRVPRTVDAATVAALVARLDGPNFKDREAAEKELAALGPLAAGRVRAAVAVTASEEVRARLKAVLDQWRPGALTADDWRRRRAVLAMRLADTPAARDLLTKWAAGNPAAPLTADAVAALTRPAGR